MGNGVNDELIRKKDALDALMAERKHLLANGQKGAEHILTHHGYNVIDELPPVQSDVPDTNVGDMISREAALDAFNVDMSGISVTISGRSAGKVYGYIKTVTDRIKALPPVQRDFDLDEKIDKAYDDGYEAGYMQAKHDWGNMNG